MKRLIDVKPKVERIYQAMQYTGENMYDIYRLFRQHSIKFNVNNNSYVYPALDIEYTGAPCMIQVDQYIVYSYPFNNDFDDTKCKKLRILEIGLGLSEIQNEYKITDINKSRATVTLEPPNSIHARIVMRWNWNRLIRRI
jgi:hypothetical protein